METALLEVSEFSEVIEKLRRDLSKNFGATIQQDVNGVCGIAGQTSMTLRFTLLDKDYSASFLLTQVSCHQADMELDRINREDK